jgi:hypothetical protein
MSALKYRVTLTRVSDDPKQDAAGLHLPEGWELIKPLGVDPIYEETFDANIEMADEIGTRAGLAIEEAITCDVWKDTTK